MKFVFSRPEIAETCGHVKYPKLWWERPFLAWLEYNGVWFSKNRSGDKKYQLSYNYAYDFFDISVFEDPSFKNPKEPIEELERFLKNSSLKVAAGPTWTWVGKTERMGKRFFIYAENE